MQPYSRQSRKRTRYVLVVVRRAVNLRAPSTVRAYLSQLLIQRSAPSVWRRTIH